MIHRVQNIEAEATGELHRGSLTVQVPVTPIRVCIVADSKDWAFANIAHQVKRNLGSGFETTTEYICNHATIPDLIRHLFAGKPRYDLIHFMWRGVLVDIFSPLMLVQAVKDLSALAVDELFRNIAETAKTTAVYDHLLLDESEEAVAVRHALSQVDAYSVSSKLLYDIYSCMSNVPPPLDMLADGVDLDLFSHSALSRRRGQGGVLRIGWAGNSTWGEPGQDHKGLKTVIEPAVRRLQREGFGVVGDYCDRNHVFVPHEDMPDYYRRLDIYVCASLHEGTPNPLLEAMASGLPILTTDVGIASQAFGPLQKMFIVQDRNDPEFYVKLKKLVVDVELRERLSRENREYIGPWAWPIQAAKWRAFFYAACLSARQPKARIRQRNLLHQLLAAGLQINQACDAHAQLEKLAQDNWHATHRIWNELQVVSSELAHARLKLSARSHRFVSWVCRLVDRVLHPLTRLVSGFSGK